MTLVLTEISHLGVAMAADSAVTFSCGRMSRVYVGAQKLLQVPKVHAGISVWGKGQIDEEDADMWLQDFIDTCTDSSMSLWSLANCLADALNDAFGQVIDDRMGIHVGGFDQRDGIRGPAFYHVHNGHYHVAFLNGRVEEIPDEDPPLREFRAHLDHPPAMSSPTQIPHLTRNGDFAVFALLYDSLSPLILSLKRSTGLVFPSPQSLASRGEYLRFWIKTMSEIYRLSNRRVRVLPQDVSAGDAGIGGPVTVLTISDEGIQSFYTR